MKQEDKELLMRDLCSRLPYGVKAWDSQSLEGEEVISITQVDMHGDVVYLADEHGNFEIKLEDIKLCLLPLSDLTKEITINGETFVPIVELAKHFDNVGKCTLDSDSQLDSTTTYGWTERHGDDFSGYCIAWNHEKNGFFVFYSEDVDGIEEVDNILYRVEYGYEVLDLMDQWHIDYRGLIERGLAVSVYELDKNPYE